MGLKGIKGNVRVDEEKGLITVVVDNPQAEREVATLSESSKPMKA